jgi:hypothetical protein
MTRGGYYELVMVVVDHASSGCCMLRVVMESRGLA